MKSNISYKEEFPGVIRIEPSATCNLACIHCPTGTLGNPVKGNMTKELFLKIKEEIKEFNIRVAVLYMGGEPFINKNFFFMVEELKKINIPFIKTVTNGMLLNKKIINDIVNSGLDSIEISLDGNSSEINDFIRKNSNHQKVLDNLILLYEEKIKTNSKINITVSSTQFKKLDKNNKLVSSPSHWIEKKLEKYINLKMLNINYVDAIKWSDMKIDNTVFDVVEDENDITSNSCDHVINTMTVRYNGDIVPCCYDLTSQLIMGNILEDKLSNIWNNNKYLKLRKSINNGKLFSICVDCSVVNKNKYLILKQEFTSAKT